MDTVTVLLTNQEAELFKHFQKRYAFMQLMESVGAFKPDMARGSITINFDNLCGIGSVDVNRHYSIDIGKR